MTPPPYYHAVHPSPYADDCPTCAGYPTEEPPRHRRRWPVVVGVALVAGVLLALAMTR